VGIVNTHSRYSVIQYIESDKACKKCGLLGVDLGSGHAKCLKNNKGRSCRAFTTLN
jgi:hypothetical protein